MATNAREPARPAPCRSYKSFSTKQSAALTAASYDVVAAGWGVGRTRFGYGAGLTYTTALSSKNLHHYFRTSFCLSASRRNWLANKALALKVMADNGADIYINGQQLLADSTNNHNPVYWNKEVSLPGSSPALVQGQWGGCGAAGRGRGCASSSAGEAGATPPQCPHATASPPSPHPPMQASIGSRCT